MHTLPQVALVGRPNVGKSTLFNRLVGKRQAVVADMAGTTRDRIEGEVEWEGKTWRLVDMAGIETSLTQDTQIKKGSQAQVEKALRGSDLLLWVLDATQGATAADHQVYERLRRIGVPMVAVVNKCDHPKHDMAQYEFAGFGLDQVMAISALHGRNTGELLDLINLLVPGVSASKPERELRLSIVGRPNVGKSTLLNSLTGEERAIVSEVAGTTRDAIDTVIPAAKVFGKTYTAWDTVRIMDTAGIRRPGKVGQGVENWSVVRSIEAVQDSAVCLFLIDAVEQLVHQDLQVVSKIMDKGRALVLLVNKWDLVLKAKEVIPGTVEEETLQEEFLDHLRAEAPFLYWVQVVFISAQEGLNLEYLGRVVLSAYNSWSISIDQEELDQVTAELVRSPRLKNLQKISLLHAQPPVFHVYVEGKQLPHFSTIRSVENALRERFVMQSTPIKIWIVPSVQKRPKPYLGHG